MSQRERLPDLLRVSLKAGLKKIDGSIRKLDESSTKLGRRAFWIAIVVGTLTLVQAIAAAMQIWKWVHGR